MNCQRCGAWASVLETRVKSDKTTRRRYECANLHRFTTIEYLHEKSSPSIAKCFFKTTIGDNDGTR